MIEPAGLGVPCVFGPHTWNFKDAVAGLLEAGGAIRVKDEAELEQAVNGLLAGRRPAPADGRGGPRVRARPAGGDGTDTRLARCIITSAREAATR